MSDLTAGLGHHGRAFSAADPTETIADGLIVAVADRPTYVLVTESGERFHWMAHLVEIGDRAKDDEYLKRCELPHPPGSIFAGADADSETTTDPRMAGLVAEAASVLAEVFDPTGVLVFWSARLTYLDGKRPCDIYRAGDVALMERLVRRVTALAEGAFA